MNAIKKYFNNSTEYREAAFSPCDIYRYYLKIIWGKEGEPLCNFIGLNPSTATEQHDDPTIRKCKGFAKRFGCGGLIMTNVFAFRSTDPNAMMRYPHPMGPCNVDALIQCAKLCCPVIAAWGNDGVHNHWGYHVKLILQNEGVRLQALKITKQGYPAHPLYLPYAAATNLRNL